jgi:putative ferrous iron transport protein C
MSLIAIKQHMQQVRMATLASLSILFKAEPETVRCMLSHWIKKGRIRQCMKKADCGSKCFKCPSATTELYEWIDEPAPCF